MIPCQEKQDIEDLSQSQCFLFIPVEDILILKDNTFVEILSSFILKGAVSSVRIQVNVRRR